VKAYLQGLHWDGVERLERWLSNYLGADDTDYSRAVGSRWLISAVARIFGQGRRPIAA
jgi:putative DNA primase/helicase